MSITPCPSPLSAALRDEAAVHEERNLFCPSYDTCLHVAVKKGWEGWTCRACVFHNTKGHEPTAKDYAHSRPRSYEAP